jgi:Flp pilus assembly protein TadG
MPALLTETISRAAGAVRRSKRFMSASGGVAAVEFAMVLPVMVLMYLGMTEMTFGVNTDRKITLLSRTLADLTGRATSVNSTEMDTIFAASVSVMSPYRSDQAKMVVSSIVVKDTGQKDAQNKPILKGTVCWSTARGSGAAALAKGSTVTVPDGFQTADSSYIRADVTMAYAPVFGSEILKMVSGTSSITLSEQTPWPVRNVKEVVWQGTTPCLT